MNYAAVIFDMDGLLVDSEPVWHEVEIELIESCGYVYADEVREMGVGMRVDEFAAIFAAPLSQTGGLPAAIEKAITTRMLQLPAERVRARPGAEEVVRYIADFGHSARDCLQLVPSYHRTFCGSDGLGGTDSTALFGGICPAGQAGTGYLFACRGTTGMFAGKLPGAGRQSLGTKAALAAGMTCFTVPDLSHTILADFKDINENIFNNLCDVLAEFKTEGFFA